MSNDEQEIRELVARWMSATRDGDIETVMGLMTDDVVFQTPGRKPFGKEEFRANSSAMKGVQIEVTSEIAELQVNRDWAFVRNHIALKVTTPEGKEMRRSGFTLTLFRKDAEGGWRLMRDANLMTAESGEGSR